MSLLSAGASAPSSGSTSSVLAKSADDMFGEFTQRIRELETLSLLRTNPMSEQDLKKFALALTKAEAVMDELARMVEKDRMSINKAKSVIKRLKDAKSRGSKLERHLVYTHKSAEAEEASESEAENDGDVENQAASQQDDNTITILSKANQSFGPTKVSTPSQKQFDSIPKYMRSILAYDDFCKICDLVNLAADRKRTIMEAPSERLGPNARAFLTTWKHQQTEDLSNLTFITDEDVVAELEADRRFKPNDIKAALQCLRNLDFVRVSPFEHFDRYVFLK